MRHTNTTTIQTRGVEVEVKERVDDIARMEGLDGLQGLVRVFLRRVASGKIHVSDVFEGSLGHEVEEAFSEYEQGKGKVIEPQEEIEEAFN